MEKVADCLNRDRIPHEVRYTAYAGHAMALTRDAVADGYDSVVSVGGDGTVDEVAAGLLGSSAVLGIIPGGSGNDYRRCLEIPKDPLEAMDIIRAGKKRPVDAIDMNGRLFMNIVNIGFGNEVSANADRFKQFGEVAYLLAVFYTVIRYKSLNVRFTIDDKAYEQPILLMDVGCGTHLGGGMNALPGADPFDGLMDVCFVDKVSAMTVIRLLPKYMFGRHYKLPIAHIHRCSKVTLTCLDGSVPVGGDGEYIENATPATMTILPGALTVYTPSGR